MSINIIAAIGKNRELGKNGDLLWRIPEDTKHFKQLTQGSTVIMGHSTWKSIPDRFRPLPDRRNIVISKDKTLQLAGAEVCHSLKEAVDTAKSGSSSDSYIIGGAQIYAQSLDIADYLYLTIIDDEFTDADVYFPEYEELFPVVVSVNDSKDEKYCYSFLKLAKR